MKTTVKLAAGTRVLVADGRKALFLVNAGDEVYPNLKTERVLEVENPATHEQGTERPGRVHQSAPGSDRRSAVAQTDWHKQAEAEFAAEVVEALGGETPLVVVAAPSFLAELRNRMPHQARALVVAEIAKDLTNLPVFEIERHLTAA